MREGQNHGDSSEEEVRRRDNAKISCGYGST